MPDNKYYRFVIEAHNEKNEIMNTTHACGHGYVLIVVNKCSDNDNIDAQELIDCREGDILTVMKASKILRRLARKVTFQDYAETVLQKLVADAGEEKEAKEDAAE